MKSLLLIFCLSNFHRGQIFRTLTASPFPESPSGALTGSELPFQSLKLLPPMSEFLNQYFIVLLDAIVRPHVEVLFDIGLLELLPQVLYLFGETFRFLDEFDQFAIAEVECGCVA